MFHYRISFSLYRPDIWHLFENVFSPWPQPKLLAWAVVYHLTAFTALSSVAIITRLAGTNHLAPNSGEMIHSEFYSDSIFSSLKCQVSSFHPALCLLFFVWECVCKTQHFLFWPALQSRVMTDCNCWVHLKVDLLPFGLVSLNKSNMNRLYIEGMKKGNKKTVRGC